MEVLLCLARTPGELVARETLLADVWGPGQGSHEALSHAVSEIRQALGDHAENPVFIQTIPKRGYRLAVSPEPSVQFSAAGSVSKNENNADLGLFDNLKQRGVFETALAYLFFGWLLIQVADIIFAQLHLPAWAGTFVTVLVIAGFPIAILLSWFLEFRDGKAVLDGLSPRDSRRRRFGRTYISVVAAMAAASVLVFLYDRQIGLPSPEPPPPADETSTQLPPIGENTIAVLPFVNLDGSNETQIFADGLVEDVITRLSHVPGLRVAARGDSYSLQPNSASQEVRNRLRVATYLEGSVQLSKGIMRVTVQMIDSASGFHILSRKFDRPREEFFDVRDEITDLTVANVRVALPPDVRESSLKVVEDPSLNVYVLYRRGVEASRQPTSIDSVSKAIAWFNAALQIDPEFAAAHAAKCAMYVMGYDEVDDAAFISNAEQSCAHALSLNPNLDIVHTALGDLYSSTGQWNNAESEYKKALEIDVSSVASLTGLGRIYMRQKRFDEAESSLRRAVDIHPGNTQTYIMLGLFLYQTGRYKEAAEQYRYVVALEPNHMIGYTNLATANMLMGNFEMAASAYEKAIKIEPTKTAYSNLGLMHYYLGNLQAAIASHSNALSLQPNDHLARSNLGDALWIAGRKTEARLEFETAKSLAESALSVNPNDPFYMMDLAWIYAMLDENDDARALIERTKTLAPDDPYTHYYDALVYLRAGESKAALSSLETAAEKGYSVKMLVADPHLESIRTDDRFISLVEATDDSPLRQ